MALLPLLPLSYSAADDRSPGGKGGGKKGGDEKKGVKVEQYCNVGPSAFVFFLSFACPRKALSILSNRPSIHGEGGGQRKS